MVSCCEDTQTIKSDVVKSSLFLVTRSLGFSNHFLDIKLLLPSTTRMLKTRFQIFLNKNLVPLTYTTVVDSQMVADYLSRTERNQEKRIYRHL